MIDTLNNIDKSQNSYPKCKKTDQKKYRLVYKILENVN